MTETAWNK